MTNLTESSGLSLSEVVHMSLDQQQWRETMSSLGPVTIDLTDTNRWPAIQYVSHAYPTYVSYIQMYHSNFPAQKNYTYA